MSRVYGGNLAAAVSGFLPYSFFRNCCRLGTNAVAKLQGSFEAHEKTPPRWAGFGRTSMVTRPADASPKKWHQLTASLRPLPAANFGTVRAGICTSAPVCGLRPV